MKISKLLLALFRSAHCCVIALAIAGSVTAGDLNSPRAESATITMSSNPDLSGLVNLYLDGRIDAHVMERLNKFAYLQGRKGVILHLNSFGGSMREGLALGRRVRELGFTTQVSAESGDVLISEAGICESACVLLFAGGRFRLIQPDSSVGVHQFSAAEPVDSSEAMADAQIFSAATVNFFRDMGVSTRLFSFMAITPAHEMQELSVADQVNLGLVNGGKEAAVWSVESGQDNALILKGVQSTIKSSVEILMLCTNQQTITLAVRVDNGTTGASSADLLIDARDLAEVSGQMVRTIGQTTTIGFQPEPDLLTAILDAKSLGVRLHHLDQRQSLHAIDVSKQAGALMAGFTQICHGTLTEASQR
ncbi:hypothetical protein K5D56_25460 [Pseudomonas cichorii]|nr:hypothetical protein [Pseudomonas cichorii]MBX8557001.1 hypothetical protein [Pseudomonas cichorii]MBX8592724.1 hypothetical protein [Pseudomonas cichorii]